jgi:hypothetical protein
MKCSASWYLLKSVLWVCLIQDSSLGIMIDVMMGLGGRKVDQLLDLGCFGMGHYSEFVSKGCRKAQYFILNKILCRLHTGGNCSSLHNRGKIHG